MLCAAAGLVVGLSPAGAQENRVFRDGSIGPACPPAPSDCSVPIDALQEHWLIEEGLGETSAGGRNLYHSFEYFDVADPWEAHFLRSIDPNDMIPQNVIARITGLDPSDIGGVLDTSDLPGANLFLLNPAGLVFTEDSSLNLAGSLYASTADVLRFGAPAFDLLTGDTARPAELADVDPLQFGFLTDEPNSISVARRSGAGTNETLRVATGGTFALVGGNITVAGNGNNQVADIGATGGTIAFASVASAMNVPVDVALLDPENSAVDSLGTVLVTDAALLDVSGSPPGDVVIRGGRFEVRDGGLRAWNDGAAPAAGLGVDIELAGVTVAGEIQGLEMRDFATISTLSFASGSAAGIRVVAPKVDLADAAGFFATSITSASLDGAGGDIEVRGDEIRVADGAVISSESFANEAGGSVTVKATSGLVVTDSGQIVARVGDPNGFFTTGPDATGGSLTVHGDSVTVTNGGVVTSQVLAGLAGGALDVTADSEVVVSALGQISSQIGPGAPLGSTAGNLTVAAPRVSVTGMNTPQSAVSQIAAITEGPGTGGTLTVRAGEVEALDGGQLRTTTSGAGNSGEITITGLDAMVPLTSVRAAGVATAAGMVTPAGIFARSDASASGDAGSLTIDGADSIVLENGGEVSVSSIGSGRAGDISILNARQVAVRGGGLLESQGDVDGSGNLRIDADTLEISGGGQASVSTRGEGDAGGVVVNAREVAVTGSDGSAESGLFAQTIFAGSTSGNAGDITLNVSERLTVADGARISVQSRGGGVAGDIEIRGAQAVNVTGGGEISAQVRNTRPAAPGVDVTADVLIENVGRLDVSEGGTITAQTLGTGPGGTITVRNVDTVAITRGSVTALSDGQPPGAGAAGRIVFGEAGAPIGSLLVSGGTISTQTNADGAGGDIDVVASREVRLQDGTQLTARSTGSEDAGNIDIDAGEQFIAVRNSPLPGEAVVSTKADNASGGTIAIRASKLIYLSDSRIETEVAVGGGNGGDFGTPVLPPPPGAAPSTVAPAELVVLNRSRIVASAVDQMGGNILVDGTFLPSDVLRFDESQASLRDSVLDATSETGTPGRIVITSPSSELAGQLVPLPSNYLDASKLLLTPCAARKARTGSFTIELEAVEPPPDAPFASASAGAIGDGLESCESEQATP